MYGHGSDAAATADFTCAMAACRETICILVEASYLCICDARHMNNCFFSFISSSNDARSQKVEKKKKKQYTILDASAQSVPDTGHC